MSSPEASLSFETVAAALYEGVLGRPADPGGHAALTASLRDGVPLAGEIQKMLESPEFEARLARWNFARLTPAALPDLTVLHPGHYSRIDADNTVFTAHTDADFDRMEGWIRDHRYYDSFGVWGAQIDIDKQITAAIALGLGGRDCLELGCFNGPVLSLLKAQGAQVCGVELSHLAFVVAFPNIVNDLRFGDLLDLDFGARRFNVALAMDILEHVNPLKLDATVQRLADLLTPDGFLYVNSPMFGVDDVFGQGFDRYLGGWDPATPARHWRQMHCDGKGWPLHGHLVWASPAMWEARFAEHGLVRERALEHVIQQQLAGFFAHKAPARRSLFVLRQRDARPDTARIAQALTERLAPLGSQFPPAS